MNKICRQIDNALNEYVSSKKFSHSGESSNSLNGMCIQCVGICKGNCGVINIKLQPIKLARCMKLITANNGKKYQCPYDLKPNYNNGKLFYSCPDYRAHKENGDQYK